MKISEVTTAHEVVKTQIQFLLNTGHTHHYSTNLLCTFTLHSMNFPV